jgi:hypothetical protein
VEEVALRGFGRFAVKRATLIVISLLCAVLLAGGSWASTGSHRNEAPEVGAPETESPEETPEPEPSEAPDDAGDKGGTVERYHGEDCTLATGLQGNWTHGDYVSAVAKDDDDATVVSDAAQSRCGKPLNAGKDGEKKPERPEKPEHPGKGGNSADHRQDGSGS